MLGDMATHSKKLDMLCLFFAYMRGMLGLVDNVLDSTP